MEIRGRNYILRHTYTNPQGVEVWRISSDDTSKDWSGHFHIHNNGLIEVELFKINSNIHYKTVVAALQYVGKVEKSKGKEVKVLISQPSLIRELLKCKRFKIKTLPKVNFSVFEYC